MASLPTTRWSLIAATAASGPEARAAWSNLLKDYRPVVLAYFRRSMDLADAEDMAQQFLARSIEAGWWARAESASGSFRRFLFVLLTRFRRDALERRELPVESIDQDWEDSSAVTPAREFDLAFVATLTRAALGSLQQEYAARGREPVFAALRDDLANPGGHGSLAETAVVLGMNPNSLVVERKRFSARLGARMRAELAALCCDEAQADREWQALQAVLRGD